MKKLVWIAGAILLLSILYPNGIDLSGFKPAPPAAASTEQPDPTISKILSGADYADKVRIVGVYRGLKTVLKNDDGKRVNNTEKMADLQANTLELAIEKPGKYVGLDVAIENVFKTTVQDKNTDASVVNPVTPEMLKKLIKACDIVIASAQ